MSQFPSVCAQSVRVLVDRNKAAQCTRKGVVTCMYNCVKLPALRDKR